MQDQLVVAMPREALAADGVVILPQFLSEDEAAELREVVFSVYDEMSTRRPLLPAELAQHFTSWNGVWAKGLPNFLSQHNPALLARYRQLSSLTGERVSRIFGAAWRLYPERTYFRRHFGTTNNVPWHIDADAARTWRRHCINLWLPLDVVGYDTPSLDLIPGSHRIMRGAPLLKGEDRYRDDAFASKIGGSIVPKLVPGDAVAFDQFTLHRTQCVGSEHTIRTSCEFRFQRGFTMFMSAAQSVVARARSILR
jgi:hypothetical protein